MRRAIAGFALVVSALAPGGPVDAAAATAAQEPPPALLLVLDASGSMNGDDGSGRPKLVEIRGPLSPATTVAPPAPVVEAAAPRAGDADGRDGGGWLTSSVIAAYLGLAVLGAACGAAAVARRR